MRLLLLGTTGYHPNDRRHTACLMLPEAGVVLDAGTAMYRVRRHLATRSLDIVLSHAHLDHIIGLTFLLDVLYGKTMARVSVHGREDHLAAVRQHLFAREMFPVMPEIDWQPLGPGVEFPHGGRLQHFPLTHPGGAVGYRIDWADRSLAYVTDTTAAVDADYVDKIRGVDVLIHECYFADDQESYAQLTGHSSTTRVAQVAAAADVGRLVLVHINPLSEADDPIGLPAARAIFPRTEIGEDGMQLDF